MVATASAHSVTKDPFDSLGNAIDTDQRWRSGALLIAACLHIAVTLALPRRGAPPQVVAERAMVVDVEVPPPPALEDPPPPPSAAPPPEVSRSTAPKRDAPPSPAQAAKVLARDEHADAPADLTGDFVTGNGAFYAGGTTSSTGSSTRVVHQASASGAPARGGTTATTPEPSTGPDRSRRASMEGGSTWQCPFPTEADDVNEATVPLRVELDASGKVLHASVVREPGHGFGREATRCVYDKRWVAALDREGSPVASTVVVVVRFVR